MKIQSKAVAVLSLALMLFGLSAQAEMWGKWDTDVPGFSKRGYTEWMTDIGNSYPSQMTTKDDGSVKQANSLYIFQRYPAVLKAPPEKVSSAWAKCVQAFCRNTANWNNAFVADFDGGKITAFKGPKGKNFLAGLEDQPFIFNFKVADSNKMYVLKEMECDMAGSDGILLRVDPKYPTIFKLSLSGLKKGQHKYPLRVMTPNGKEIFKRQVKITAVKPVHLKVKITDEDSMGKPIEAMVTILGPNGRVEPSDRVPFYTFLHETFSRLYDRNAWPIKEVRANATKGMFDVWLPPGKCTIAVGKSFEYRVVQEVFDFAPGEKVKKTISPKRFVDMPAMGWYSGDDHCHIPRDGTNDSDVMDALRAVDLHATNIVQMGDEKNNIFMQSTWGEPSRYFRGNSFMVAGQEDPRTGWRGHTLIYDIPRAIWNRENYYLYEDAFKEARDLGGLVGYAHSSWAFKAERGATVSAALNLIDFIELDNADKNSRDVIYHFWNLGFKITAANGSDFPWGQLPGGKRFFVYVPGEFTFDKYMEAFKAGHTFSSVGGTFINITANGKMPGDTLKMKKGKTLKLKFEAMINPDYDMIDRVEIVKHGEVIDTIKAKPGATRIADTRKVEITESAWIAARVFGKKTVDRSGAYGIIHNSCAHTTPFYVEIDGKSFLSRKRHKSEIERANASLDDIESQVRDCPSPVDKDLMDKQSKRLMSYIKQARNIYSNISKEARK